MEISSLAIALMKNYDDPKLKRDIWLQWYSWRRSVKSGRDKNIILRDPKRRMFPSGACSLMAQIYMAKRREKTAN